MTSMHCKVSLGAFPCVRREGVHRTAIAVIPPRKRLSASGELVEQRLGVSQHRPIEAFGERAIHRREEVVSFRALTMVTPQASETGCSAQPEGLRALPLCHSERSTVIPLRIDLVASRIRHVATESMQLYLTG